MVLLKDMGKKDCSEGDCEVETARNIGRTSSCLARWCASMPLCVTLKLHEPRGQPAGHRSDRAKSQIELLRQLRERSESRGETWRSTGGTLASAGAAPGLARRRARHLHRHAVRQPGFIPADILDGGSGLCRPYTGTCRPSASQDRGDGRGYRACVQTEVVRPQCDRHEDIKPDEKTKWSRTAPGKTDWTAPHHCVD